MGKTTQQIIDENSKAWHNADAAGKKYLEEQNKKLHGQLDAENGTSSSLNTSTGKWETSGGGGSSSPSYGSTSKPKDDYYYQMEAQYGKAYRDASASGDAMAMREAFPARSSAWAARWRAGCGEKAGRRTASRCSRSGPFCGRTPQARRGRLGKKIPPLLWRRWTKEPELTQPRKQTKYLEMKVSMQKAPRTGGQWTKAKKCRGKKRAIGNRKKTRVIATQAQNHR